MARHKLFDSKPSTNYLKQVFEIDSQFPLQDRLSVLEKEKATVLKDYKFQFEYWLALKEFDEAKRKVTSLDNKIYDNRDALFGSNRTLEEDFDEAKKVMDARHITLSEKTKNYIEKCGENPELHFTRRMEQSYDTFFQEYSQLLRQKKYFEASYNSLNTDLQTNFDMELFCSFKFLPLIQTAITDIQTNLKLLNLATEGLNPDQYMKSVEDNHTKLSTQFTNLKLLLKLLQKLQEADPDALLHLTNFQLDANENLQQLLKPVLTAERHFTVGDQQKVEALLKNVINEDKKLHGSGVTFHEEPEPDPPHVTFHSQKPNRRV